MREKKPVLLVQVAADGKGDLVLENRRENGQMEFAFVETLERVA